jgi:hypothetical protein
MPVILAIREAEIRRIKVLGQPHFSRKSWAWLHTPVRPAIAGSINRMVAQASQGKKQDCISKISRAKGLEA